MYRFSAAMYDYQEYCPIAKAGQLLGERWTLLIIRELLCGSRRFNEIRRHLPRISPTLLRTRLRYLEDEGILVRVRGREHASLEYELSPAGEALAPVLQALASWSTAWQYEKFSDGTIFLDTLMRDLQMTVNTAALPGARSVLKFLFSVENGIEPWYMLIDGNEAEACDDDRGLDVDVYLAATPRLICDILLGKVALQAAIADGSLHVTGSRAHIERIDKWFTTSSYASEPPA